MYGRDLYCRIQPIDEFYRRAHGRASLTKDNNYNNCTTVVVFHFVALLVVR